MGSHLGSRVGKLKSRVGDIGFQAGPELEVTNPAWGHRIIPGGSWVGKLKLLHERVDVMSDFNLLEVAATSNKYIFTAKPVNG